MLKKYTLTEADIKNICSDCSHHHSDRRFSKLREVEIIECKPHSYAAADNEELRAELQRRVGIYGLGLSDLVDPDEAKFTAGYDHADVYEIEYYSQKFKRTEWFYLYEFYDPREDEDSIDITRGYAIID